MQTGRKLQRKSVQRFASVYVLQCSLLGHVASRSNYNGTLCFVSPASSRKQDLNRFLYYRLRACTRFSSALLKKTIPCLDFPRSCSLFVWNRQEWNITSELSCNQNGRQILRKVLKVQRKRKKTSYPSKTVTKHF